MRRADGLRRAPLTGGMRAFVLAAAFFAPATGLMAQTTLVAHDDVYDTFNDDFAVFCVLLNDEGGETADPASVQIVSGPAHGAVYIDEYTGDIIYFPDAGYVGGDSFEYRFSDFYSNTSNAATVSVDVRERTSAPVITSFGAYNIEGNVFCFEGTVMDENLSTVTISFGGILSGETVGVEADGSFCFCFNLDPENRGAVSAQATDEWNYTSNIAWDWVN